MKKTLLSLAVGLAVSTSALANNMYIALPNNSYDMANIDANSTTGTFNEFGFTQTLATSVYSLTDGSVLGSFYDTNIASELSGAGIPTNGTAMNGTTPVALAMPTAAQVNIDALSPLVPPLDSDGEGYLMSWFLNSFYHFDGTLTAGGPVYTGGTFDLVFMNGPFGSGSGIANGTVVLSGKLTGSELQAANLNLFFDITYALNGFLFIDDGKGNFIDAATLGSVYGSRELILDTNVNPPYPADNQLLQVGTNAIRQTTLDGSVTANIPEPSTLALAGLGLLGFGAARRRKQLS